MPAYVGNPLAGDPIWEASSAFELRIAITTKQVSRAGHPSDLLLANGRVQQIASRVSIGCKHGAESGSPVQLQQRRTQTRASA
jgi:hypothetical protein